jgi:hypothetical protein
MPYRVLEYYLYLLSRSSKDTSSSSNEIMLGSRLHGYLVASTHNIIVIRESDE